MLQDKKKKIQKYILWRKFSLTLSEGYSYSKAKAWGIAP